MQGYPQFAIFAVLGLGIPVAFLKPYWSFLFSVLLLTAGSADAFNQTRTSYLGPFLNLSDACLLVALAALFFDKFKGGKPIFVPLVIALLLFVLTIAAYQSFWRFGLTYETLRACRWAVSLPIAFFVGANLVTSPRRAKMLVAVLFCGAVFAAVQHLAFATSIWQSRSLDMETFNRMRTISYRSGGMMSAFLLATLVWGIPSKTWEKWLCLAGGVLFVASILLSQTRSVWLAAMGSIPCLLILFRGERRITEVIRFAFVALVVIVAASFLCRRAMPGFDIVDMVNRRMEILGDPIKNPAGFGTRARTFNVEMNEWYDGTLILGRGLSFFRAIDNSEDPRFHVAFGHLGYVTYLSQLGIIGLLVYGVFLPFSVLRRGLWLWSNSSASSFRYVGLLGGASIIYLSIMFLMSSCFLGLGYEAPGVLYGALWSLVRSERKGPGNKCVTGGAI